MKLSAVLQTCFKISFLDCLTKLGDVWGNPWEKWLFGWVNGLFLKKRHFNFRTNCPLDIYIDFGLNLLSFLSGRGRLMLWYCNNKMIDLHTKLRSNRKIGTMNWPNKSHKTVVCMQIISLLSIILKCRDVINLQCWWLQYGWDAVLFMFTVTFSDVWAAAKVPTYVCLYLISKTELVYELFLCHNWCL